MRICILLFVLLGLSLPVDAQFAPQAGVNGSTAISASDSKIVAWAKECTAIQGWKNIADKSKGKVTYGAGSAVVGKYDGSLLSLGDSGIAIVTFDGALYNGPGPDFAVFENGFSNPANPEESFMELAFVEVSSDGVNYVRFPATSKTDTPQVPGFGVYMNARKVNNLAGKYISKYGTPFDLEELKGHPELDIDKVTHIRIVDVVGDIGSNGSKDKDGNTINDPYPTEFNTGGFDLDAVAAFYIPGKWPNSISNIDRATISLYPNPVSDRLYIKSHDNQEVKVSINDVRGMTIKAFQLNQSISINTSSWANGVYLIRFEDRNGNQWVERIVKY